MKIARSHQNLKQQRRIPAKYLAAALAVMALAVMALADSWPVLASGVAEGGITDVEIGCNNQAQRCREVEASFSFPAEDIEGYLILSFAEATLLGDDSFEFTAELIDPRDPQYTARLPRNTFIPDDFPVLITVEPTAGSNVSFRRNWTLEVIAENLEYSSNTPYRLFRAPNGEPFRDISHSLGSGSYRVRGAGGRFSQFLIAADLRPFEQVVTGKVVRLRASLTALQSVIGSAAATLNGLVDQAVAALEAGNPSAAVARFEEFINLVEASTEIPDDTTPSTGTEAAAARLLADALTLQHAVFLGLESAQGGMSGFSTRLTVGEHKVDVSLEFDEAYVVDEDALAITAEQVDVNNSDLRSRLPDDVHVPEEFPVLIRISPVAGEDQAFSGNYEVELQTDSLNFLGGSPLRLFKAPDGGAFEDITRTYGLGSYRVRGAGGRFSEFLIAEDLRPVETIVARKFDAVTGLLEANTDEIPAALRQRLAAALTQARVDVEEGKFDDALIGIEEVIDIVDENSGDTIPALWRSEDSEENLAGELIAVLESLFFSIEVQETPPQAAAGDANLDGHVDVADIFFLIDQIFGDSPPPAEFFFPPKPDEK